MSYPTLDEFKLSLRKELSPGMFDAFSEEYILKLYSDRHPSAPKPPTIKALPIKMPVKVEDEILAELRAIRIENEKIKWAVRSIGLMLALLYIFGVAKK